jgi:hypothetical protein
MSAMASEEVGTPDWTSDGSETTGFRGDAKRERARVKTSPGRAHQNPRDKP